MRTNMVEKTEKEKYHPGTSYLRTNMVEKTENITRDILSENRLPLCLPRSWQPQLVLLFRLPDFLSCPKDFLHQDFSELLRNKILLFCATPHHCICSDIGDICNFPFRGSMILPQALTATESLFEVGFSANKIQNSHKR